MSRPSGTDDNPNQTQEISRIGEQNVDKETVGSDISKSSHNKRKRLRSDVWTVFEKCEDGNGNVNAKCSLCEKSFDGSSKKGTSHLRNHFNSCQKKRNGGGASGSGDKPAGNSVTDQQLNHLDKEISHVGEQSVDQEMVGLDISKSSRNKQKKLRSDVWKMFVKCKDENGKDLAKCSLCERLFDGSSKKGTTHLRNHFKSCQNKRNEGGASGSGDKPAGNSVTDQQLNHLDRVKMLIKQYHFGSPKPAGDTDIINVYKKEKEKLRIYFEKLGCRFSLKITNGEDGKYTGFVVHFIDDDWKLKKKIIGLKCIEGDRNMKVSKNVLSDFGINNKISSMVTDCDSDIYVPNSDKRENGFSGQGSCLSNCKFCLRDFHHRVDRSCPNFEDKMEEVPRDHLMKFFNYITETSSKIGTFQIAARSLGKEVTAEDIPTKEMLKEMFHFRYWFDRVKIALDQSNSGKWVCKVREPNKKSRNWLGTFPTAKMAARGHDVAAIALRGRLACSNFADSAWRLPVPASFDAKDMQKAVAEAVEAFRPAGTENVEVGFGRESENMMAEEDAKSAKPAATENVYCLDEESVLWMPGLLASMAEGMLLSPPQWSLGGDDVADDDSSIWHYMI